MVYHRRTFYTLSFAPCERVQFFLLRISQSVEMNAVESIHIKRKKCTTTTTKNTRKTCRRFTMTTFSRWLEKWQMLIVSIRMKNPLWNHAIWLFAGIITYRKNLISADIIQLISRILLFFIVNLFTRTTAQWIIFFIHFHQL